jgi:hypothetical protein
MEPLAFWEQILLGVAALVLLWWLRPGIKNALERSRQAEQRDWLSALLPLALVALFVLALIALA